MMLKYSFNFVKRIRCDRKCGKGSIVRKGFAQSTSWMKEKLVWEQRKWEKPFAMRFDKKTIDR